MFDFCGHALKILDKIQVGRLVQKFNTEITHHSSTTINMTTKLRSQWTVFADGATFSHGIVIFLTLVYEIG